MKTYIVITNINDCDDEIVDIVNRTRAFSTREFAINFMKSTCREYDLLYRKQHHCDTTFEMHDDMCVVYHDNASIIDMYVREIVVVKTYEESFNVMQFD